MKPRPIAGYAIADGLLYAWQVMGERWGPWGPRGYSLQYIIHDEPNRSP